MSSPVPHVRLAQVVVPITRWDPRKNGSDDSFRYIDISSVGRASKRIDETVELPCREAPSRARQRVQANDVLVSTVRPNLNAVALVTGEYDDATASTGFTVLRPRIETLDPKYLFYWVRTPRFVSCLVRQATGASYPAVSDSIVKSTKIPLPPLDEQRRIAAILDKADAIRRKRKEAIQLTEELLRSTFLEMFGDPVTNPMGWPIDRMHNLLLEAQYGTAEKANTERRGLPVLRMNNITDAGGIDLSSLKWVELTPTELPKRSVRRGDLLFNRTNSPALVGKTAVWHSDEPFAIAGYLIRMRFRERLALPDYVSGFLNSSYGKLYLFTKAKASNNMSNFSAGLFKEIPIPRPPIDLQEQYARFVVAIEAKHTTLASAVDEADNLFNSLVQRAFRGEL